MAKALKTRASKQAYISAAQPYSNSIEHRIVSIHQPHVRPIVRGKTNANVEFGAKIQVRLMNGFPFLEEVD